ncbi:MAG: toxic anion resistance protein [Ruminococcus sp.]|nr:toxic anion resistance protein [Ruminococcus sp.]
MAIQMKKDTTVTANATVVTEEEQEQRYDIVADRKQLETQLVNSPEVDNLTGLITLDDTDSILTFGNEVATQISKASDTVLNSMSLDQLNKESELFNDLSKIMAQFDIKELKEEPKGLAKLFGNAQKQLDKFFKKYDTIGSQIDKLYVDIKKTEEEIKRNNTQLQAMHEANVQCYHELVKYIVAGEQACKEIENVIADSKNAMETTGDQSIRFEIQTYEQALEMMQQRVQDLRIVENIAMQSIPMLQTIIFSNYNLLRKSNSAVIISIPVFKQGLAQAVLLRRQGIQAKAFQELDKKTNELLIKNAQNTADQARLTAQLASGSSVSLETLETTWNTIMQGISDTQAIQEQAKAKRIEDEKRLASMKEEYTRKYGAIK